MTQWVVLMALLIQGDNARIPLVEAPDLTRRPDLVDKTVAVEGRVRLFLLHEGRGFDQIELKQTPVRFDLPAALRFADAPTERSVRIEGVLEKSGDQYHMDVRSLRLLPEDHERLSRALAAIPKDDYQDQLAWTGWALRRAEIYEDEALAEQARKAEAHALTVEAESPGFDSPKTALELAQRARSHKIPEPIPSALAHRAYSALAKNARSADEFDRLVQEVESFLPRSRQPGEGDTSAWDAAYEHDPFHAYRLAPDPVRTAFDRRLLADLLERWLKARAEAEPGKAAELSEEAKKRLPDRPQVTQTLLQRGLEAVSANVESLSRDDLMKLVRKYDQIGQPERGRALVRAWLQDERANRISRTDAEGRVALADKYVSMLDDKDTAVELLREAWAIDPQSKAVTEAFRSLGFHKEGDEWVKEPSNSKSTRSDQVAQADSRDEPSPAGVEDPLLRLTPAEVVARLGKPDHKSQVITQGIVTIQWVYKGVRGSTQYIIFRKQAGLPPTVIGRYSDH
jgi:tetratricopeptide (TPR) repeat protein